MQRGFKRTVRNITNLFPQKTVRLQTLLEDNIKSDSRVLIPGPGSFASDKSPRFIRTLVKEGEGRLMTIDKPEINVHGETPGTTSLIGGSKRFREDWEKWERTPMPDILSGNALSMPLKRGTVDVIFDHEAHPFIINVPLERIRRPERTRAEKVKSRELLSEYLRVTGNKGKIIMTSGQKINLENNQRRLERIANELGINVSTKIVKVEEYYPEYRDSSQPFSPARYALVVRKKGRN